MNNEEKAIGINSLGKEEQYDCVVQHPWAIKYLDDQRDDLVMAAIKANPKVLCLVRNQTEEVCKCAVSLDYTTLAYVRNLTDGIVEAALAVDQDARYYLPEELFARFK